MATGGTAKVIERALVASALAAVVTVWAASSTGASAMLAAAILTVVTASSLALLRTGMTRAERPADAAHPFGYAGEVAFWSFVVPILLFALGAGVTLHEGVSSLVAVHPIVDAAFNFVAIASALALLLFAAFTAHEEFVRRRGTAPALVALRDLKDPALASAVIQSFAAVAGLILSGLGLAIAHITRAAAADGCATLLIGLLLAALAALMSIEVRALIAGEAASPAVIHDVRAAIAAERGVGRAIGAINEIRTLQLGPRDILVVASVDFEDETSAAIVEAVASRIEAAIKARHPNVRRVYLEGQSAREYGEAERTKTPAASAAPLISQAAAKPVSSDSQDVKAAAQSATLPQRESRKGRKRQKGKRR